uniref:(northern house mosquito) hypothetical protein n=2 Tax=Culex pipiens TaxID=7175 RepID=A0A8D8FUX9_CULPI
MYLRTNFPGFTSSQPPAAMFVSISVAVADAAVAETDVDAAGGAEFCDVAVGLAGRTAMLAGTGDAAEAAAVPGPATLLATVEDAIRLFAGSPLLAALTVATPGQVLLLALELLLLLPTEGGAGDGDSEHESGEDSDDDEDDDDILLVLLTAAAAATIW